MTKTRNAKQAKEEIIELMLHILDHRQELHNRMFLFLVGLVIHVLLALAVAFVAESLVWPFVISVPILLWFFTRASALKEHVGALQVRIAVLADWYAFSNEELDTFADAAEEQFKKEADDQVEA